VRKNVNTEDAPVFHVLAKLAKFCETGLRIVTNDSADENTITVCLVVFTSLLRCVQDEGVQLVVNKNYDKDWASQYKSIMSGHTDVQEENINAMDRTATILKHRYTSTSQPTWPSTRGRGRGARGQQRRGAGAYRGKFRDFRENKPRDQPASTEEET
jgi:hypothetical protein